MHVDFGSINWQSHVLLWKGENCNLFAYVRCHLNRFHSPNLQNDIHVSVYIHRGCYILISLSVSLLSHSLATSILAHSHFITCYNVVCADVLVCFMNAEFIVLIRGSIHVRRSCCERNCIQFIYTNARRRRRNMVYSERYTHEKKKKLEWWKKSRGDIQLLMVAFVISVWHFQIKCSKRKLRWRSLYYIVFSWRCLIYDVVYRRCLCSLALIFMTWHNCHFHHEWQQQHTHFRTKLQSI